MTTTLAHSKIRTCSECSKPYQHDPCIINGTDMIAHFTQCDPCAASLHAAAERKDRENNARNRWESAIPQEYRKTRTDHPEYPQTLHEKAMTWLKSAHNEARRPFLGLIGQSGRGKSRVASQVAKRLIWNGGHSQWCESFKFQWACQNQFNDTNGRDADALIRQWRETANLIFDDIGSLKSTEVVCDTLYALLEYRSSRSLPMIWTSNETPEEMLDKVHSEKSRARIISRLKGYSEIIEL